MTGTGTMGKTGRDWLEVGALTAPWGLKGEIKIRLDADFTYVKNIRRVYLGPDRRPYSLTGFFRRGRFYTVKLDGVDTVDAAEEFRGRAVGVPRAEAPPLPSGAFYVADVLGLRAVTTDGRELGTVADVIVTGANDVYVVHGPLGELLIPAIRDVVVEIAPDAGLVRVEPMAGLLPESKGDGRRATGDGRRATGDGREATEGHE